MGARRSTARRRVPVNGGEWRSATFDASLGDLASLERLTWTVALDPSAFGTGDHEVEVRALTEDGVSLSSLRPSQEALPEQAQQAAHRS